MTTPVATFAGTLDISGFERRGNNIVAVGAATGTLTDAGGTAIGAVAEQPLSLVVSQLFVADLPDVPGKCNVLHLGLGPMTIPALGLVIDVSLISLDVTADPVAQKPLQGLFCKIDQLLQSSAPNLTDVTRRLNHVLRASAPAP